jgi:Protein of unknown function (DUF3307)
MNIWVILSLLTGHYVADFLLQSHWMASNKSKRLDALSLHVAVYSAALFFTIFSIMAWFTAYSVNDVLKLSFSFVLVNGLIHWATDFITSRITSELWAKKEYHWFFCVIGFDQLMHQFALLITLQKWMFE